MARNQAADGLRILLIEDEMVIAMTAEDMLEELGHRVTSQASTFNEAMESAAGGDFDLALLDINLNGVMSLPVARLLRDAGRPFVFTTGYGNVGLDPDFADVVVVTKPYTMRTLEEAIRTATAHRG